MYSIGLETSQRYLLLCLMNDEKVIDSICYECLKQQSEYIIVELDNLTKRNNLSINDIDSVVVTVGPGSYTGVRIGMTVAKILGSLCNKTVYTLSTLQLYAGKKDCYVVMDAKAKRVYFGQYVNGRAIKQDSVIANEEVEALIAGNSCFVGDLHLFGKDDVYPDLAENFFVLRDHWRKVENVDILTPVYLKSKEDYLKNDKKNEK